MRIKINQKRILNTLKNLLLIVLTFSMMNTAQSQDSVLKCGVSIDKVPKEFYGTWRVKFHVISSTDSEIFKDSSLDLWNLSRSGNVITLENPFSGAKASIILDEVRGKLIRFQKVGDYDGNKLTDTVEINLEKETFIGINTLKLDTISDGRVINSESTKYKLYGGKIS